MTNEQKIDAHCAKAASLSNAIKQGMRSRTVVASGEDYNEYLQLYDEVRQEFAPRSPHETFLCKQMADARWRLDRFKGVEAALFDMPEVDSVDLDRNSRCEVRMENSYYKACKQLLLFRKAQEAARPKADAQADAQAEAKRVVAEAQAAKAEAEARAEAEQEAREDSESRVECLYWLNKETGEITQVAGPPQPYDPTQDPTKPECLPEFRDRPSPKRRR